MSRAASAARSAGTPQTAEGMNIRPLHGAADYDRCTVLEKRVWGYTDIEVVPTTMFVVAGETGGQIFGAFDPQAGGEMVGFVFALPAFHGKQVYLHSHMTAVLPEYQNRGVGRQLKLYQRKEALRRGIRLVEWTFDPLEIRNAYFNLVRLGAIVRRFIPNCYGVTSSPLHGGMPTDRLLAEWWLDTRRVRAALGGRASARPRGATPGKLVGRMVAIFVPARINELKASAPDEALRIQAGIREEFQHWLARGYVASGLERTDEGANYLLEPYARSLTQTA